MQQRTSTSEQQLDSFGLLLKQWRNQRGYSQLDLAEVAEWTSTFVSTKAKFELYLDDLLQML